MSRSNIIHITDPAGIPFDEYDSLCGEAGDGLLWDRNIVANIIEEGRTDRVIHPYTICEKCLEHPDFVLYVMGRLDDGDDKVSYTHRKTVAPTRIKKR